MMSKERIEELREEAAAERKIVDELGAIAKRRGFQVSFNGAHGPVLRIHGKRGITRNWVGTADIEKAMIRMNALGNNWKIGLHDPTSFILFGKWLDNYPWDTENKQEGALDEKE